MLDKNLRKKVILVLFGLLWAVSWSMVTPACSQVQEKRETEGDDAFILEPIIITATRTEHSNLDIPQASATISRLDINEHIFTALVDLLDKTPGFTQIWEYHSPLVLRGMTSKRLIALKDGNRRMSSMPGGFMGQTLNIYDIERVEVIRGPGSVMYGSGAISGIVNIITSNPFDYRWFGMRDGAGFASKNLERIGLANVHWGKEDFSIQVSGRFEKADDYVYGDGETAENSFIENKDIAVRVGWKAAEKHTTVLNAELHFGGPWGKPVGFNNNVNMKANNEQEDNVYLALRHTVEDMGFFHKLVVSGFYNHDKRDYHKRIFTVTGRPSAHEVVQYKNNYGGSQMVASLILKDTHLLNVGLDGYAFRLDSPSTKEDFFNHVTAESKGVKNAGISSIGLFLQDEWDVSPDVFSMVAGLRYDVATVEEGDYPIGATSGSESRDAFSGNLGLIYHPIPKTSLTLNVGRAFRMPEAQEMFSKTVTCRGTMLGNPDVEPEYSWNIDLGYRGFFRDLGFDAALFANFLDDMIDRTRVPDEDEDVFKYDNIAKARIMGGEFVASYLFKDVFGTGHHLKPGGSIVYARGDDLTDGKSFLESGDPLHGIPPLRLRAFLRTIGKMKAGEVNHFFEVEADYFTTQGRLPDDDKFTWGVEKTGSYGLIGLTAGMRFHHIPGRPRVNLKVKNLFNKEYKPFSSYILGMGTNVKVFVEATF